MDKFKSAILLVVLLGALTLLIVGLFGTGHKVYSRFGEGVAPYDASDPELIREFSFA